MKLIIALLFILMIPEYLLADDIVNINKLSNEMQEKYFNDTLNLAKKGNIEAQYLVGVMYNSGKGVTKNNEEALKWMLKAAKQGDADAQFNVGSVYYYGEQGITKNYKEAFKWRLKAAEQGHIKAQSRIGDMYDEGKGISRNTKEAFKWRLKAAEQNDESAQFYIGAMYYGGIGVKKSYIEAYKWYCLLAIKGTKEHIVMRDEVEKTMTPEQIAKGQELAAEWQAKHQGAKQ